MPAVPTGLVPDRPLVRCLACGTRFTADDARPLLVFTCTDCGLPFLSAELLPHAEYRCADCRSGRLPVDLPDSALAAAAEREIRAALDRDWRGLSGPTVTGYLDRVACLLARRVEGAPERARVLVVDDLRRRTLGLPSGTLLVSVGTLRDLEDEAELAFVLGHELAHAACADAAVRLARLGFLSVANDGEPGDEGWGRAAHDLIALGFGRHRERDADLRGLEAMLALGYDPASADRYLARLGERIAAGDPRVAEVALAHPTPDDRRRRLERALHGRLAAPAAPRVNREVFRRAAGPEALDRELRPMAAAAAWGAPPEAEPVPRRRRSWLAWVLAAAATLVAIAALFLAR